MEEENKTGWAILGYSLSVVIVLECFLGIISCFGVYVGKAAIVGAWIPSLIISAIILKIKDIFSNTRWLNNPYILIELTLWIFLTITFIALTKS